MPKKFILTAVGEDKPGVVSAVAKILYELGCNIEDSSMTQLRGNFAMMMVVSIPDEISESHLCDRLNCLKQDPGISVELKPFSERRKERQYDLRKRRCLLTVSGSDKPGIIYEVSKLIAEKNINIADINSRILTDSSGSTYITILELEIPAQVNFPDLKMELSVLGEKLGVEINIEALEGTEI